jgi:hypothetical protein
MQCTYIIFLRSAHRKGRGRIRNQIFKEVGIQNFLTEKRNRNIQRFGHVQRMDTISILARPSEFKFEGDLYDNPEQDSLAR